MKESNVKQILVLDGDHNYEYDDYDARNSNPNDPTDISDRDLDYLFQEAVRLEKLHTKMRGLPTAEYDSERKRAYLLYPDGRREYFE